MKRRRIAAALLALALLLTVCAGCAARKTPSAEDFAAKAEAAGFPVEDVLAEEESPLYDAALLYTDTESGTSVQYTVFQSADLAQNIYASFLSGLSGGGRQETRIDSAEYSRFFAEGDGTLTLLWRNGTAMIVLNGSDSKALRGLIDSLGI